MIDIQKIRQVVSDLNETVGLPVSEQAVLLAAAIRRREKRAFTWKKKGRRLTIATDVGRRFVKFKFGESGHIVSIRVTRALTE